MFFIVGISKTKILDKRIPGVVLFAVCTRLTTSASITTFRFFSFRWARVKKGEPFVLCERCHRTKNEFNREFSPYQEETGLLCTDCANPIHRGFYYCPYCGKKL